MIAGDHFASLFSIDVSMYIPVYSRTVAEKEQAKIIRAAVKKKEK